MDVLSIYICPLGAGLAGIMFFWVCGKKYVEEQVNLGREKKFTDKFLPICKYIYCPTLHSGFNTWNRIRRNRLKQG